jgi:hypothetical protein
MIDDGHIVRCASPGGGSWQSTLSQHHGVALAAGKDGGLTLYSGSRCWRSSDATTWQEVEAQLTGPAELDVSGRLLDTAMFGLTAVGRRTDPAVSELWLRTSPDDGTTWYDFKQDLQPSQNPDVQSLLYWRGMVIVIAWTADVDGRRTANQYVGRHGRLPLEPTPTNLFETAGCNSHVDLSYNPSRSLFEILHLQLQSGSVSIDKWSLPPHKLTAESGEWSHEGAVWSGGASSALLGHSVVDERAGFRYTPLILDGTIHELAMQL